jgi:hypothetical protein
VALYVTLVGEKGGGPDGGPDGREPLIRKVFSYQKLGGLGVGARAKRSQGSYEFLFSFALALVAGVELLPALGVVL